MLRLIKLALVGLVTFVVVLGATRAPDALSKALWPTTRWEIRRRPGHVPITPENIAGTYVGDMLAVRTPDRRRTLWMAIMAADTLRFTADGRLFASVGGSLVGTHYTLRGDSMLVTGGQRPRDYLVMLFYDRIVLMEWSAYDFDGDTELETAIRRSVLVRLPKRPDGVDPSY
jgi:hypothetical protein